MRQPLLGVALLERARTDAQADRDLSWRRRVLHQRITHAVGKGAELNRRIGGNVARRLWPSGGFGRLRRTAADGEKSGNRADRDRAHKAVPGARLGQISTHW